MKAAIDGTVKVHNLPKRHNKKFDRAIKAAFKTTHHDHTGSLSKTIKGAMNGSVKASSKLKNKRAKHHKLSKSLKAAIDSRVIIHNMPSSKLD